MVSPPFFYIGNIKENEGLLSPMEAFCHEK
jgi:hypothetical protein